MLNLDFGVPALTRLQTLYPGQFGVPGSDQQRGLRNWPRAITLYVDSEHNNASDAADGTDPDNPKATLQSAVTQLQTFATAFGESLSHSEIRVAGDVTESIEILDYTLYPSYCTIRAIGPGPFSPAWSSGDADSPCLVAGAVGWRITGFRFYAPSAHAAVVIPCTQAPWGANAIGIRTIIDNNYFDGSAETGLYGIDLHGAPYNPVIVNNIFGFFNNAGNTATALTSTNSGYADTYRALIASNWFHENDNHIILNPHSLNVSAVVNNLFQCHGVVSAIMKLDLRLGTRGENLVSGNVFEAADYSHIGGFWENAANPGMWAGNVSGDTAEAEVGDNGWTIAPPT